MRASWQAPLLTSLVATATLFSATHSSAIDRTEVSSKVLYQAVDQLTEYLEKDLPEVSKHTKKTAIINFTQSEELPTSIKHYLVKRLEHLAQSNLRTPVKFLQCIECLSLNAVAEGDEIFIRQGITNDKQLKNTMSNLGIRKYSDINLAYTGDQLVMQVNVVNENKLTDWSAEYRTPYKAYNDSQWQLGVGAEVGSYQGGEGIPAAQGARVEFGQRLTGFGAAGISASYHQDAVAIPKSISVGTFLSLSHNEYFNQYWDFMRLYYQAELGVTDFNGNQLLHERMSVKSVLGKYYSVSLNTKFHQFMSKPTDSSPIANPNGRPVLNNNDPLPTMISLVFGVELL